MLCVTPLFAQQESGTSGGSGSGTGGTVNYSIGLPDYVAISGTGGSATLGIQHTYDIKTTNGSDNIGINLTAYVYPNPLTEIVKLKIEGEVKSTFSYFLTDAAGNILKRAKIQNTETSISMLPFPNAVYFIKVVDETNELKTFKIIKAE